ncbi:MAG: lysine 5,6-aminomutase subunit alpha [Alphaproteobacteria bacterium]
MANINLPQDKIEYARKLAQTITNPVQEYIKKHTTTTVERATLRLLGADGADENGIPVPNLVVDAQSSNLEYGAARYYLSALTKFDNNPEKLNDALAKGYDIKSVPLLDMAKIKVVAEDRVMAFSRQVSQNAAYRQEKIELTKANQPEPLLYVIVATGNIYEDVKQAQAAAEQGADIIAVIRTTAQSLLDYVPYGATTEGFGGTYATQENFKIMRAALDDVSAKQNRYIRLVNYCSGLCMPEIAAMGALERLDMMLNDSMYGILFRDINMYRTFVDQNFSRMINSFAGIVINTGEDNYLTTSDAVESAHTVLASQLLNERFALNAGLKEEFMGLGHAFEMDPSLKDGFLFELAQAQMAREIFPKSPLKYMPPTKHMTGDIFKGYIMNAMFNFVAQATGQSILLLGMLTEAIHTPFMQDRFLAIKNAKYVMNNMKSFGDDIVFKDDGIIKKRAFEVFYKAIDFMEEIEKIGLFEAIAKGLFADVKRPRDGGKGFNGVVPKAPDYYNPVMDFLENKLEV